MEGSNMCKENKDEIVLGYSRRIDGLGRVDILQDLFEQLDYEEEQSVEITIERGQLCIKKFDWDDEDFIQRDHIGMVGNIDILHRLVIPKEFRKVLNIKPEDMLFVFLEGDVIKMRKAHEEVEG